MFLLLLLLYVTQTSLAVNVVINDTVLINDFSLTDFVSGFDYPIEVHKNLETKDGYLLDIHRIPRKDKSPVLLVHGLATSGDSFAITGPDKALPFLLHDKGHDVWIHNARGTPHSRKHRTLDPDSDSEFWDFSWHEIGVYDLPTVIEYIRDVTNQEKLFYIGHSQGTTVYAVLMSERPEFNDYIRLSVALAPSVFYGLPGIVVPEDYRSVYAEIIENFRIASGLTEIGPQIRDIFCSSAIANSTICDIAVLITGLAAGVNPFTIDWENFDDVKKIFPVSAAFRQYLHYLQLYLSGNFEQYDFGDDRNLEKYGTTRPPRYNLENLKAPMALYFGLKDVVATAPNAWRLKGQLKNVVVQFSPLFYTHAEFIMSQYAKEELYDKIIMLMEKY